jgi:hypothetical protein
VPGARGATRAEEPLLASVALEARGRHGRLDARARRRHGSWDSRRASQSSMYAYVSAPRRATTAAECRRRVVAVGRVCLRRGRACRADLGCLRTRRRLQLPRPGSAGGRGPAGHGLWPARHVGNPYRTVPRDLRGARAATRRYARMDRVARPSRSARARPHRRVVHESPRVRLARGPGNRLGPRHVLRLEFGSPARSSPGSSRPVSSWCGGAPRRRCAPRPDARRRRLDALERRPRAAYARLVGSSDRRRF